MTFLGEYPPLDALPADALRKTHVRLLMGLCDAEWERCDRERTVVTDPDYQETILARQHELETVQAILRVIL